MVWSIFSLTRNATVQQLDLKSGCQLELWIICWIKVTPLGMFCVYFSCLSAQICMWFELQMFDVSFLVSDAFLIHNGIDPRANVIFHHYMKIFFNNAIVGFSASVGYGLDFNLSFSTGLLLWGQDRSEATWCIFSDISLSYSSAANGSSWRMCPCCWNVTVCYTSNALKMVNRIAQVRFCYYFRSFTNNVSNDCVQG